MSEEDSDDDFGSEGGDQDYEQTDPAARRAAMDRLVPAIEPSDYGKMPPSFHSNSQRVARTNINSEEVEASSSSHIGGNVGHSRVADTPKRPIRPPIIPRDQYDGVDSDDETDEEDNQIEDEESEEEKPQVVGEIDIDMEEEQEEFLEFARQTLGVSDEQWASIVRDRKERGGEWSGVMPLFSCIDIPTFSFCPGHSCNG